MVWKILPVMNVMCCLFWRNKDYYEADVYPWEFWTSFWWLDVLPDINQLRLGKRHWNLAISLAEVEYRLRTQRGYSCFKQMWIYSRFRNNETVVCSWNTVFSFSVSIQESFALQHRELILKCCFVVTCVMFVSSIFLLVSQHISVVSVSLVHLSWATIPSWKNELSLELRVWWQLIVVVVVHF